MSNHDVDRFLSHQRAFVCIVAGIFLVALTAGRLLAQHEAHGSPNNNGSSVGVIDGSKTPDLVPDAMAYQLFFTAVSEPPNPTPAQRARQFGRLRPVALSPQDKQVLVEILTGFYTAKSSTTDLSSLAASTAQLAMSRLSPSGGTRLRQYVQNEKRHMRLVPFPKM